MRSRWLIFVPVICFVLFAKPAQADVLGNWTFSQSGTTGSVEVVNNSIILHGPDNECCGSNWVKIETTIPGDTTTSTTTTTTTVPVAPVATVGTTTSTSSPTTIQRRFTSTTEHDD